ncbi:hypothetical protein M4Q70_19105, partial [Acidovorax valerianellae]|nr:hypothetical protein [Paracidovorax valerianellae]
GNAQSTSRAGISGVAGNTEARTGDAETGIKPIFDKNRVSDEVNAQITITREFGRQGSTAWGNYANQQYVNALASGDKENTECWSPEGGCRAAGHAIVGMAGGGVGAGAAAAITSMTAPEIATTLRNAGTPDVIVDAVVQGYGAGIGGAVGGSAGASAGVNEAGNNTLALNPLVLLGMLVVGGSQAIANCVNDPGCKRQMDTLPQRAREWLDNIVEAVSGKPEGNNASPGKKPADTYGTPPNGPSLPPGDKEEKNPDADRRLNQEGEMVGRNGTQTHSNTVFNRGGTRIDVENANPGQRPGQLHLQVEGDKYYFNVNTGLFEEANSPGVNAPRYINEMLKDPKVRAAVNRGMQYLGEKNIF